MSHDLYHSAMDFSIVTLNHGLQHSDLQHSDFEPWPLAKRICVYCSEVCSCRLRGYRIRLSWRLESVSGLCGIIVGASSITTGFADFTAGVTIGGNNSRNYEIIRLTSQVTLLRAGVDGFSSTVAVVTAVVAGVITTIAAVTTAIADLIANAKMALTAFCLLCFEEQFVLATIL
ncbi:hypothetical protein CHS0354_006300 [Potamilus streckersoni]|uniref:Uncharacterized protein n=1 Tax=Potamilus streckersoni TaxID=2493646 RepID=A0AAE0S4T7_9BIVA|nr:hypothetical protein CHS0354_006300 [Potamilus streckersoni]